MFFLTVVLYSLSFKLIRNRIKFKKIRGLIQLYINEHLNEHYCKYATNMLYGFNKASSCFNCLSKINVPRGIRAAINAFTNQPKFFFNEPITSNAK